MYPLGLHPIGFILILFSPTSSSGAIRTRVRFLLDLTRAKLIRLLAWVALLGGLCALELVQAGPPSADDALAYKAAALFSFCMFLFLPDCVLACLLVASACFMGWHSMTSAPLTGGAAIVVVGISPVLAFLFAYFEHSQASGRRRPNWMAEDPFFDFCGRRR